MPYGSSSSSKSSSLSGWPSRLTVSASAPTARILASKIVDQLDDLAAVSRAAARTVASSSSRSTERRGSSSEILTTSMSLNSCLVICSSGVDSTSTTIVMRLKPSSSAGATASEKMLKPRRANSPATRASTPGRFWTSTDRMWWSRSAVDGVGARSAGDVLAGLLDLRIGGQDEVVVALAGRDHREHLLAASRRGTRRRRGGR